MAWIIFKGTGTYTSGDLKLRNGKKEVPDDHPILDELRELDLQHVKIVDSEPEDVPHADEAEGAQPLAATGELSTDDFADPFGEDPDAEAAEAAADLAEQTEPDAEQAVESREPADDGPAESPADPDESPEGDAAEVPGGAGADQTDTAESVQADAEQPEPDGDEGELDQEAYEATDAAVKHAEEAGVDLSTVKGTGKDGKITAEDVDKAAESTQES